ncbi:MAG: hypothetical protein HC939_20700 [Pleurocapsa sp. SU_5_0]|nr:hypothetical protein [Pleurocapsa sp. SU_5_0]
MPTKDTTAFFALKHAIDDQVARLGWSKERCIVYIKDRYKVRSRLSMSDDQLRHLLKVLSSMSTHATSERSSNRVDRRRRKKRF